MRLYIAYNSKRSEKSEERRLHLQNGASKLLSAIDSTGSFISMDIASVSAPLGQYFTDLLQARREDSLPADATALSAAGAVKILELKSAHRQLCESTDALRVAASEAKSQLDSSSLQLQNLLYERQHYEKEIASCLGWQSAYTDEQVRRRRQAAAALGPATLSCSLRLQAPPHTDIA